MSSCPTALVADISTAMNRSDITESRTARRCDIGSVIADAASNHHAFARRELPRLDDLLSSVMAEHGEHDPDLAPIWDRFVELSDQLYGHMIDEERVVFPLAIQLLGAVARPTLRKEDVDDLLRDTLVEDDQLGAVLADLLERTHCVVEPTSRSVAWADFRRGVVQLHAATRDHLRLEHTVLFPAMLELNASLD